MSLLSLDSPISFAMCVCCVRVCVCVCLCVPALADARMCACMWLHERSTALVCLPVLPVHLLCTCSRARESSMHVHVHVQCACTWGCACVVCVVHVHVHVFMHVHACTMCTIPLDPALPSARSTKPCKVTCASFDCAVSLASCDSRNSRQLAAPDTQHTQLCFVH